MNTLKKILLAGMISLTLSCNTTPSLTKEEKYNILFLQNVGDLLILGYDTDGDGYEDKRYFYKYLGFLRGFEMGELIAIQKDLNNNHTFEEDEFIYEKESNQQKENVILDLTI